MQKYSSSSYQEAARTRERGLLGNVTDSLLSGNRSITGSIGRGISKTFKAKVTGLKEKFDPMNIAKKLTGNTGAALIGRATGRSREDMEYFSGQSPRGRSAPAQQYTKTGPDLGELSKALYTKVSEGQQPKLKSGDSVSNVMGKLYNLLLINSKLDYDAREEDKKNKIEEDELKEKQHEAILKALTGTGRASPVKKEKKEEDKSFLGMIGDMIKSVIDTVTGMIASAVKQVTDMFGWITDFKWLTELGWLKSILGFRSLPLFLAGFAKLIVPVLIVGGIALTAWAGKQILDKLAQWHTGDPNATIAGVLSDKVKGVFGIKTEKEKETEKANADRFKEVTDTATKNKNTIDEDVKKDLMSQDWVRNDPKKVAALNGFKVNPKQNVSATEVTGSQLPGAEQSKYNIGNVNYNSSTGVMTVPVSKRRPPDSSGGSSGSGSTTSTSGSSAPSATPSGSSTPSITPTASPTPPEPSPIASRMLEATANNTETKLSEDTTPKMINIDNSKKMGGGGDSSPPMGMDSSVSVRIDDPTLQKIQKQGLRPV
jgi:hypothetical protein